MTSFTDFIDSTLAALPAGEASARQVGDDKFVPTVSARMQIIQAVADLTVDELQEVVTTSKDEGVQERLQGMEPAELLLAMLIAVTILVRFAYLVLGPAEPLAIESA